MVRFTEKAKKKIREVMKDEKVNPSDGIRISLQAGGCNGFTYNLAFDKATNNDKVFFEPEDEAIFIHIDPESLKLLDGTIVDYVETPLGGGFSFLNPQEKGKCGCGHSAEF